MTSRKTVNLWLIPKPLRCKAPVSKVLIHTSKELSNSLNALFLEVVLSFLALLSSTKQFTNATAKKIH